jgi:hypothetical protein
MPPCDQFLSIIPIIEIKLLKFMHELKYLNEVCTHLRRHVCFMWHETWAFCIHSFFGSSMFHVRVRVTTTDILAWHRLSSNDEEQKSGASSFWASSCALSAFLAQTKKKNGTRHYVAINARTNKRLRLASGLAKKIKVGRE